MCETHLMPIPIMTSVADDKSSNIDMAKKWMRWYLKCEECSTVSDWPETNIKITKTASGTRLVESESDPESDPEPEPESETSGVCAQCGMHALGYMDLDTEPNEFYCNDCWEFEDTEIDIDFDGTHDIVPRDLAIKFDQLYRDQVDPLKLSDEEIFKVIKDCNLKIDDDLFKKWEHYISHMKPKSLDPIDSINMDELGNIINDYTQFTVTLPNKTQCEYVGSRGKNKGIRCTVMCKNGPLCSKHNK
tara:strand:- start:3283 stop:4020 length:738 start_codon:yes stop_codon:yes gene_type:complete